MRPALFALPLAALLMSGCEMLDGGYGMDDGYGPPPSEWDGGAPEAPYRATGTEPFWSVTIDDREMRYEPATGRAIAVPVPRPTPVTSGERYADRDLEVTIVERPCSDGMSDRSYPDTVTVRVGGRTLYGCGGGDERAAVGDGRFAPPSDRFGGRDDPRFDRPDSGRGYDDGRTAGAGRLAGDWRVVSVDGRPSTATLSFDGRRLTGRSCNRLFGDYTLTGNRLAIDGVGATRMACEPALMQEEAALIRVLEGRPTLRDTGGARLELDGGGGRAILAPR